ncbi:unnamed protein product, partial [Polarella glacialis]
ETLSRASSPTRPPAAGAQPVSEQLQATAALWETSDAPELTAAAASAPSKAAVSGAAQVSATRDLASVAPGSPSGAVEAVATRTTEVSATRDLASAAPGSPSGAVEAVATRTTEVERRLSELADSVNCLHRVRLSAAAPVGGEASQSATAEAVAAIVARANQLEEQLDFGGDEASPQLGEGGAGRLVALEGR